MAVKRDKKTGKWVVKIDTQRNGRRVNHYRGGFRLEREAKAYERDYFTEIDMGNTNYLNMTLQDVYDAYILEAESKVKATTLWKKQGFLRRYLFDDEEIFVKGNKLELKHRLNRNMKMNSVTSQDLRKLKNELTSVDFEILGSHHKNKVLGEIREYFNFAKREFSNVKENVYQGVLSGTFLDENEIIKEPPIWDLSDFISFLWTFDLKSSEDVKWSTFFLTIWTCHLRIGEILGLRVKDFQNGKLYIRQAVVNGKGYGSRVVKPKSKSSERVILLDEATEHNLNAYLDIFTKIKDEKGEKFDQDDFLFSLSNRPVGRSTVKRKFMKHVAKYNNDPGVKPGEELSPMTIHGLRASGSSLLLDEIGNSRENLILVQERMGHSEMSTTQKHYLNRSKKAQDELKTKLNTGFRHMGLIEVDVDNVSEESKKTQKEPK